MNEAAFGVTVVISTYKLEKYLAPCLDGLLAQTFQNFDVLIIDDASPDGTVEIARAYQARMPERIRVRALEQNTGLAARVRNLAMEEGGIRGEYALFLDGDDEIEPDMLERLVDAARERRADIAICSFDRLDEGSGRVTKPELGWLARKRISPEAGDLAYINTSLWNKLIRRDLIGETRIPQIRIGEDALFLLSLYAKCERFVFVPRPLLHYRVRAVSVISRTGMEDIKAFGEAFADLYARTRAEVMRRTLSASAFVHIGLSMGMRAAANPGVSVFTFTKWAKNLFRTGFDGFRGAMFLSARALFQRGGVGVVIWIAKWAYRLGLAPVILGCMRLFGARLSRRAYW